MLRFFSKIRYRFATENKLGGYLRYAIGEILLVVIGILIALQVNNLNATRKNNIEFRNTVAALEQDLNTNIRLSRSIIYYAYQTDSIINLVLNKEVSREMYRKDQELRDVIKAFRFYTPVQDNLIAAINYENHIPHDYKPLVSYLKYLKAAFDRWEYIYQNSTQSVMNYNTWLADNFYWFSQDDSLAIERNIDYLLGDPLYLNKVYLFRLGYLSGNVYNIFTLRNLSAGILAKLKLLENKLQPGDLNEFFQELQLKPYKQVKDLSKVEITQKVNFRLNHLWFNGSDQTVTIYWTDEKQTRYAWRVLRPGDFATSNARAWQLAEVEHENGDTQFFQSVIDGYLLIE